MTANQISASAVRESERHNAAVEAETTRHNKVSEDIENDRNQIQRDYNDQYFALQERWNKLQLDFQTANEDRKRIIEQEMNDIKWDMNRITEVYNAQMSRIENKKASSDAMYKSVMGQVAEYNSQLQAKRDYYTNQKTEAETFNIFTQIGLARRRLRNEEMRIQNDYELGFMSLETRNKELDLARERFGFEEEKWNTALAEQEAARTKNIKANTLKQVEETAVGILSGGANLVTKIFGFR